VSATAERLQDAWQDATGTLPGVAAVRMGDGISEHTFYVSLPGERLELAHRLLQRHAFLYGIEAAVRLVAGQRRGLFGMRQLLGLTGAGVRPIHGNQS